MRSEELYKVLKSRVLEVKGEIQELQTHNHELRVRLAALQLAWRVLREARAAARAARGLGAGNEPPCGLEALLLDDSDSELSVSTERVSSRPGGDLPSLLDAYPHLAPGASLLGLEGNGPVSESTLEEWLSSWGGMIQQALALGVGEPGRERPQELSAVGARIKQTFINVVFWRFELYMEVSVKHLQTHVAACGMEDAPLAHWERATRAVGLTQLQARVLIELTNLHEARLAALAEERATLSSLLGSAVAAAAAQGPLAPAASAEGLAEDQQEAVEALNANMRRHQAAMSLYGIFCCALMTPAQFATLMALSYPWPVHSRNCMSVLAHDLKFRPETFADEAA